MQHDPSGLRAVVLDSPWPPEASWTGPLPTLVSRELRQVLSLCAADHKCSARYPDLQSRFDVLLSSWLSTPPVKNGHDYSAEEMAAYLLDALYDDEGARSLPKTIDQILRGDYSALDKFLVAQSDYNEGQFFTHLCKEEFPFESPDSIEGADSSDPIAKATARAARRYFAACSGFKVGAPDAVENQPVVSDIPTLMISGDIDAGCQAELTDAAVKTLSHGQAFNLPNMTHAPAQRSPCAKRMVAAFYADPLAKVDASCIAGDRPTFPFILAP
jgi:pimeloyl-ACP methyl ester carboxylesterase